MIGSGILLLLVAWQGGRPTQCVVIACGLHTLLPHAFPCTQGGKGWVALLCMELRVPTTRVTWGSLQQRCGHCVVEGCSLQPSAPEASP